MKQVLFELREQLTYAKESGEEKYTQELEEAIEHLNKMMEERSMNNELTLTDIIEAGKAPFAKEKAAYLLLYIQNGNDAPELIMNPKENFEKKLEYLKQAYNEDLTLKNNTNIRIVDFNFYPEQNMLIRQVFPWNEE